MKRLMFTAFILLLLLTACGTQAATSTTSAAVDSLPAAAELALGTLKLEGAGLTITADQASAMLPLWQVYQSLAASDTAAQAEIEALVTQIQGTLSADQWQAVQDMHLTRADLSALISEQSISVSAPQSTTDSSTTAAQPAGPDGGGMPPSDMGGDPSMTGGVQPVSSSASDSDTTPVMSSGTGVPSALVSTLIELLESRAG